jgi:peptide/nickel transport system ATP-binding protein
MSALLQIDDLRVEFDQGRGVTSRALRGITLEVGAGEVVGLVGETGCGKTLTGLSVLRLLPKNARTTGSITFAGTELTTLSDKELRKLRGRAASVVFQSPSTSFNPVFTVGRQLEQVARAHLGAGRREAAEAVRTALGEVGLPAPERIMQFYPHELSGGMLQRAMIAMAILCRPQLLIADEPTTALDVTVAQQILLLLRTLQREHGFGVLFISHDLELVGDFCDRVAVVYAGRVIESGPAVELLRRPRHPYTRALLDALPDRSQPRASLPTLPGGLPSLVANEPAGCAFAERCPLAVQRCLDEQPRPERVDDGHDSACHRREEM